MTDDAQLDAYALIKRLAAVGSALSAEHDFSKLLEMIVLEAKDIAGADGGTLYFRTDDEMLEYAIVRNDALNIHMGGTSGVAPTLGPIPLFNSRSGQGNFNVQSVYAVLKRKAINIDDVYAVDVFDFEGTRAFDKHHNYRTKSVITIPMVNHQNHALGCLQLVNAKDPATGEVIPFSKQSQDIVMSLASQAAIILDNKQLIHQQEKLLESFIKLIAKAIDDKSPYTGAHCERVPVLTEMLAEAGCRSDDGIFKDFNLDEMGMYELRIAAWLHDCGKIITPVHIMDKATKLETIYDRIELIKARFALLMSEARVRYLDASISPGADAVARKKTYDDTVAALKADLEFVTTANIGGEFMSDEHIARLHSIAARRVVIHGVEQPLLNENELKNLSTRRGTITDDERKIMNDHMVHTVSMLDALPFPKHLKRVPEYACGHHERMDGKGYPKGLKAGDMSIPARMMAVADVFEALTASDRPYKPAKKLSEAMKIIGFMKKEHHLDPAMVDLFIREKVYMDYARRYLAPELIDAVDEEAILAMQPNAA